MEMKDENKIDKKLKNKILLKFLNYLRKKEKKFVEKNRLAIIQTLYLLRKTDLLNFIDCLKTEIGLKNYPLGIRLSKKKNKSYSAKLNNYFKKYGGLNCKELKRTIRSFCRLNRLPFNLYYLFVRDFLETNGDIITCFDLFASFKKANVNVFLESDKYKIILHFPKSQSDTFKLEIFNNTKKSDINLFLKENWHIIGYWKKKNQVSIGKVKKGKVVRETMVAGMADYPHKKAPTKGLFRTLIFLLEDYKKRLQKTRTYEDKYENMKKKVYKYTDYHLLSPIFGEIEIDNLSDEEFKKLDKRMMDKIRKMRERLSKTDIFSSIIPA